MFVDKQQQEERDRETREALDQLWLSDVIALPNSTPVLVPSFTHPDFVNKIAQENFATREKERRKYCPLLLNQVLEKQDMGWMRVCVTDVMTSLSRPEIRKVVYAILYFIKLQITRFK